MKVGIDANGAIASLAIGGANFQETPERGGKLRDSAFTAQFIGKSGTLAYGVDVDAVAGATVTSTAVLPAINRALAGEAPAQAPTSASASDVPVQVETLAAPDAAGAVKICKATVQGYASEIVVTVGLDAAGTIVSLKIGGPNFAETDSLGAEVQTNVFRNQFLGKSGTLAYGTDVDAVAGATITSNAVLKAINAALAQ